MGKNLFWMALISLTVMTSIMLTSCSNDDDNADSVDEATIFAHLTAHSWKDFGGGVWTFLPSGFMTWVGGDVEEDIEAMSTVYTLSGNKLTIWRDISDPAMIITIESITDNVMQGSTWTPEYGDDSGEAGTVGWYCTKYEYNNDNSSLLEGTWKSYFAVWDDKNKEFSDDEYEGTITFNADKTYTSSGGNGTYSLKGNIFSTGNGSRKMMITEISPLIFQGKTSSEIMFAGVKTTEGDKVLHSDIVLITLKKAGNNGGDGDDNDDDDNGGGAGDALYAIFTAHPWKDTAGAVWTFLPDGSGTVETGIMDPIQMNYTISGDKLTIWLEGVKLPVITIQNITNDVIQGSGDNVIYGGNEWYWVKM